MYQFSGENGKMSYKSGLAAVARQDNARTLNRERGQSTERARWTRAAKIAYDHRVAVAGTTILGGAALFYKATQGRRSAPAPAPADPPLDAGASADPARARAPAPAPAPAPALPLAPVAAPVAAPADPPPAPSPAPALARIALYTESEPDTDTPNVTVTEVCCQTDPTQVARRMYDCEDYEHDAAALTAMAAERWGRPRWQSSLDGIVRISHRQSSYGATETREIINHDPNFVSDHNAVNVSVQVTSVSPSVQFNIITHNLEGLCGGASRATEVRRLLPTWYEGHIKPGTLMVVQELALQKHKKDADKQEQLLDTNLRTLLSAIQEQARGCDMRGVTDKYTGCLIYDANAWEHNRTEEIRRPRDDNKRSNAYLMRHKRGNFHIWLVNIHLKAFGGISDFFEENLTRDNAHVEELRNIIERLVTFMGGDESGAVPDTSKTPIYLCGDFNNPNSKLGLVQSAVRTVQNYAFPDEEEGSLSFVSVFGATHRRGRKRKSEKIPS